MEMPERSGHFYVYYLQVIAGHEAPVSSLCFSSSHPVLLSGSWDKTVKIWDVYSSRIARETLILNSDGKLYHQCIWFPTHFSERISWVVFFQRVGKCRRNGSSTQKTAFNSTDRSYELFYEMKRSLINKMSAK